MIPLNPVRWFTGAYLSWFGSANDDKRFLDLWRDVPPSDVPTHPDDTWHRDQYEYVLAKADADGTIFERAADVLLTYRYYAPQTLTITSDFGLADRLMQPGDRIVQRIPFLALGSVRVIDVMAMNVVEQVWWDGHRAGFVVLTTVEHPEQGRWHAEVTRSEAGRVVLTIDAVARPHERESKMIHSYVRWRQKRAHRAGWANFSQLMGLPLAYQRMHSIN